MGEDIVKAITEILREAQAEYRTSKVKWCYEYIEKIRKMVGLKIDEFTGYVMEHVEEYLVLTEEEKKMIKEKRGTK